MSTRPPVPAPYSTRDVSLRSGYSVDTLVLYAFLQRQEPEKRRQAPPKGMPQPQRVAGGLCWPVAETDRWLATNPKRARAKHP